MKESRFEDHFVNWLVLETYLESSVYVSDPR